METNGKGGFALPFALLMGSVLLILGTLFISHGETLLRNEEERILRQSASQITRSHVRPLVGNLIELLKDPERASALVTMNDEGESRRSILKGKDPGSTVLLYSVSGKEDRKILFTSPVSETKLQAGLVKISPESSPLDIHLAWTCQDLGLESGNVIEPDFWPLDGYRWAPTVPLLSPSPYLDSATNGHWLQGPWIPLPEDLPFHPESSPSLVPVVEELNLIFGIFASGPARHREKELRIRYYLEGKLWNPYNRSLRFHSGSGSRPVFRAVFHSLPEVRVKNLTKGVSTNWIRLDEARNKSTGAQGVHGWISLPAILSRGDRLAFKEPDPKWQPEGLARTLHPAFPVGAGDSITLELRDSGTGVHVSCLSLSREDPLKEARRGIGWHRTVGFPVDEQLLEFSRADQLPRPFYLSGGSLSFRIINSHFKISTRILPPALEGKTDPRRLPWDYQEGRRNASGQWIWDRELISVSIDPIGHGHSTGDLHSPFSLFSWPGNQPTSLLEASDLPQWLDGFRLGSAGASELNNILQQEWAWGYPSIGNRESLPVRSGGIRNFRRIIPVNTHASDAWDEAVLQSSVHPHPSNLSFPLYPWFAPDQSHDLHFLNRLDLSVSTRKLVAQIQTRPSYSVAQFFDRGLLANSMPDAVSNSSIQELLPLRAWLRNGIMPRNSGPAWILHLAVHVGTGVSSAWSTARIWLQETEVGRMELIQFEWTAKGDHLFEITP